MRKNVVNAYSSISIMRYSHLLQPKSYYRDNDGDKGNAFYFTILRDPSSVFESLYGYYDLARPSLFNMNIHQYIEK